MPRREEMAERIAEAVVKRLQVKKYVEAKDDAKLRAAVRKVLLENLETEEQLDAEARRLLLDHAKEIKDTASDYRRLLVLVRLYGRKEVLAAVSLALEYQTYDAAYVEALVLQQRRRHNLPSPTPLRPKRGELIEDIYL